MEQDKSAADAGTGSDQVAEKVEDMQTSDSVQAGSDAVEGEKMNGDVEMKHETSTDADVKVESRRMISSPSYIFWSWSHH